MRQRAGSSRFRGDSLIEVLIAIALLVFVFLVWCSAAITAYQGENTAAENTLALTSANYLVEEIRRDANFWAEPDGKTWTSNGQLNPCGALVQLPAYADAGPPTGAWHDGLNCASVTVVPVVQPGGRPRPLPFS